MIRSLEIAPIIIILLGNKTASGVRAKTEPYGVIFC